MRDNIDMTSFKFGGKIKVLGYITNKITTDATESSNISPFPCFHSTIYPYKEFYTLGFYT